MQSTETTIRPEIKIQNTICTADLKQRIDITSFNEYPYLSANLDLYRCGYVKDENMVGRVTVFASGKLISVGTKSPDNAYLELKKASSILKKYKLAKSFRIIPEVRNIVAIMDLGKPIPLEKLARTLPKSMYEPDQFSGLIYRIQGSFVALLFASGKGVLVGAKNIAELNQGYFEVFHKIF